MTVSIDKHGEISMKMTEWEAISEWLEKHPEYNELSVNEVIKIYIRDEQKHV